MSKHTRKSIFDRKKKGGIISLQVHEGALKQFGDANISMLYQNIRYWCAQNAANDRNFHDGLYWTYNSIDAFTVQFPMWSPAKLRVMLSKLESEGWIKVGEYNTMPADRTKWYADLNKKV